VLEPMGLVEAHFSQLETLRGLCRMQSWAHSVFTTEMAPEIGPRVQLVAFDRISMIGSDIKRDQVACYFDLSAVDGSPDCSRPLGMWRERRTPIILPHQLGWMHFNEWRTHQPPEGPLDQSCSYQMPGATATIYVYDHGKGAADPAREFALCAEEVATVGSAVLTNGEGFNLVSDIHELGRFSVQCLASPDKRTLAAVACLGAHFIKARITYEPHDAVEEAVMQSLAKLAAIVEDTQAAVPN
jgi:hypothetical protein